MPRCSLARDSASNTISLASSFTAAADTCASGQRPAVRFEGDPLDTPERDSLDTPTGVVERGRSREKAGVERRPG
eukprot:357415-Chlamydomonas_euryale.AAC.1